MFCLIDACWEKNEKKKRKKEGENRSGWGFFSQGQSQTCLAGWAEQDFHGCWVQLKDDLRVSL
jgi:hypothetical protein